MSAKTVIFLIAFAIGCGGALYAPVVGVVAYVLHYTIAPESQWWYAGIAHWGMRLSLLIAAFLMVGTVFNAGKLRYGKKFLVRHEWLILIFVGLVWLSWVVGGPPIDFGEGVDSPQMKFTKVIVFALLLTHIVTTVKRVSIFFWAIVIGAGYLGYQAWTAGAGAFVRGRLDGIGGPDFREANFLAAFLVAVVPIIGLQFIRSGYRGKIICAVSGVLVLNGIILTRSRGAFIGLAGMMVIALLVSPGKQRKGVLVGIILIAISGYLLTDDAYWERTKTIRAVEGQERDKSAQSRLEVWRSSWKLLKDHPLGVGAGRFQHSIKPYYSYEGEDTLRDAHSTYVRCYSELGIQGILVYLAIVASALLLLLRRIAKESRKLTPSLQHEFGWFRNAVLMSVVSYSLTGLTVSTLFIEAPYWFLAMPVCLVRALHNAKADVLEAES